MLCNHLCYPNCISPFQLAVVNAVRKVVNGSRGVTALWVTHRLEELRYADGAAYMEDGQVVFSGPVNEVKEKIMKYQQRQRGMR